MADLADRIDDLICSFEGGGDTTMDTVAMLIFGWTVFGLFVLAIGKYVYARYFAKIIPSDSPETTAIAETVTVPVNNATEPVTELPDGEKSVVKTDGGIVFAKPVSARSGGKFVPPTPPLRKRLSTKKGAGPSPAGPRTHASLTPPTVTGPDPESVRWVNEIFLWLYSDLVILNELLYVWIQSLNEFTKKSVAEVRYFNKRLQIIFFYKSWGMLKC